MKVQVTKKQHDAFGYLIKTMPARSILRSIINGERFYQNSLTEDALSVVTELEFDDILQGLVNGFEPIKEDITVVITPKQQELIKFIFNTNVLTGMHVNEAKELFLSLKNQIEGVNK